jgi:hypothetical protein
MHAFLFYNTFIEKELEFFQEQVPLKVKTND